MSSPKPRSDQTKSETVVAIREIRARLSQHALRRLREELFRRQLALLEEMVEHGVDPGFVAGVANAAQAIAAIDQLQTHERQR